MLACPEPDSSLPNFQPSTLRNSQNDVKQWARRCSVILIVPRRAASATGDKVCDALVANRFVPARRRSSRGVSLWA